MIEQNEARLPPDDLFLGIDIGSTTIKAVLMTEAGEIRQSLYERTKPAEPRPDDCNGRCSACGACYTGSARHWVDRFLARSGVARADILCTVATGSQVVEDAPGSPQFDGFVSEISAHLAGARHYHPNCRAILDVGGQDSKAMLYEEGMGMWVSKMSGICAAGTGAFLDNIAAKLGMAVEEIAGRVNHSSTLEFSSVCAVLTATSVNKFKSRYPVGDILAGACRAQARTIMAGVGQIFRSYRGEILFQGGVASNPAVAHFLREITGNPITVPEHHPIMGAIGAACLARQLSELRGAGKGTGPAERASPPFPHGDDKRLRSVNMRAAITYRDFFSRSDAPLVWRNLFFPAEILNALGVRTLTLETYPALYARDQRRMQQALDSAAAKGFSAETCSFLRAIQGLELPKPAFVVSTSQPCQQGERVFADLVRSRGIDDRFYSLHTPVAQTEAAVETVAAGLEEAVGRLEWATGTKMDLHRLAEACRLSNEAREISMRCNHLRLTSPPLIRGSVAAYFATVFSQLWGRRELVDIQRQLLSELESGRERVRHIRLEDTHRIGWLHMPPFHDNGLLEYIETRCRAPIVFEEVNFVGWQPMDAGDSYRSLARKLLTAGFLDPKLRVHYTRDVTLMGKFDGLILYNHGFGRCSMSDSCYVKHLREELHAIGVPLLQLDGDCIDRTADPCSTHAKVNAFIEELNVRRYGSPFGLVHNEHTRCAA